MEISGPVSCRIRIQKRELSNKMLYQVDAFTDTPFKGNPAGVMIVDESMAEEKMQNIAMEMNLSETAFIIPGEKEYQIRYFTPTREVPLCGHATLAGAHIIYETGLKAPTEPIDFMAKAGHLRIAKEADWIVMHFPEYPLNNMETPGGFQSAMGFEPVEIYSSSYGWVVAVAENEKTVAEAQPDFELLKAHGLGHLMVTARSESYESDFVVRCFVPESGINEDPVTGSAHCALTPLWSEKLGKKEMNSLQLSERSGQLRVKLLDDGVEIKGKAVTVFKAWMKTG